MAENTAAHNETWSDHTSQSQFAFKEKKNSINSPMIDPPDAEIVDSGQDGCGAMMV